MKKRVLLFVAGLAALIVGYIEMRLPDSVGAQGRNAVFGRLAVTDDVRIADSLAVGGSLTFGTALTPAMTALLAASGTASDNTFLRGDGFWAVGSPPTYWDISRSYVAAAGTTWVDTGLSLSVPTEAGDKVVLTVNISSIRSYKLSGVISLISQRCYTRISGGTSALESEEITMVSPPVGANAESGLRMTFVDIPGAGTHDYSVQFRARDTNLNCSFNSPLLNLPRASTFLAQVLK